jgi:putative membrane protein
MYGWHYQSIGGGWWILMMMGMVPFLGALTFGAMSLRRNSRTDMDADRNGDAGDHAVEILKERLARGEITEEEYARLLATLKGQS